MDAVQVQKSQRLEQRVTPAQRALIERGAEARGQSLSEFIIASATLAAELAIMNQRVFYLDDDAFDAFIERLDGPAQPNPGLDRLFAQRAPWLA